MKQLHCSVRALAAAAVVALAACSGHGGSLPPAGHQQAQAHQMQSVQFSIKIPSASTQSGARKPQYISAGTTNASVSVSQGPGTAIATATISSCREGQTCSGTIEAPVGTDTFDVKLMDDNSTVLSHGTTTASIVAGQANSVNVSFGGVVAIVNITVPQGVLTIGTATSVGVIVDAQDPQNYHIIGSEKYDTPITLTLTDVSNTLSLSTTQVDAPGTQVQLDYNGGAAFAGAQISASVAGANIVSSNAGINISGGGAITGLQGYRQAMIPINEGSNSYTGTPIHAMANGPDGRVWMSYMAGNTVALDAVDPRTASVTQYPIGNKLWITGLTSIGSNLVGVDTATPWVPAVVVFDATGTVVARYPDSNGVTNGTQPSEVVAGSDGNAYLVGPIIYKVNMNDGTWSKYVAPSSCYKAGHWATGSDGNLWAVCDDDNLVSFDVNAQTFTVSSVHGNGSIVIGSGTLVLGSDNTFYSLVNIVDTQNYVGYHAMGYVGGAGGTIGATQLPDGIRVPNAMLASTQGKIALLTQDANKYDANVLMFFDQSSHAFTGEYIDPAATYFGLYATTLRDAQGQPTGFAFLEGANTVGIYMP